ncbi:MAG: DUF3761 domain-containing protein [Pyrinomonadaceae bacterium]
MKNYLSIFCILIILVLGLACGNSRNTSSSYNQSGNTIKPLVLNPTASATPATNPSRLVTVPPSSASTTAPTKKQSNTTESKTSKTPSPVTTEKQIPTSGATARCRDGSLSYSQNRRGTCSHHGGVAEWY